MPPKRKSSANLDGSDAEGPHPDVSVHEDESAAPKKRGRKSFIDAILQEEGTVTSRCESLPDIWLSHPPSSKRNTGPCLAPKPVVCLSRPATELATNDKPHETAEGSTPRSIPS